MISSDSDYIYLTVSYNAYLESYYFAIDDVSDFLNPTTAFKGNFNVTASLTNPGSTSAYEFYNRPEILNKNFFTRDYFRLGSLLNVLTDYDSMAVLTRNLGDLKFMNIKLNPSDASSSEILSGMFTGSLIITHIKPKN